MAALRQPARRIVYRDGEASSRRFDDSRPAMYRSNSALSPAAWSSLSAILFLRVAAANEAAGHESGRIRTLSKSPYHKIRIANTSARKHNSHMTVGPDAPLK
jgi:hypothetical protein